MNTKNQIGLLGNPNSNMKSSLSISYQYLWFFAVSAGMATLISFSSWSRRPGVTWWDDLKRGMPESGDLGLGLFLIRGVSVVFNYPFRLLRPTWFSLISPWICYIAHQSAQFYVLSQAREAKERGEIRWGTGWNIYGWKMLVVNLSFVFLHVVQTHFFYNGLSGSFPELGSLIAVIIPLLVLFVMESRRRGLFMTYAPPASWNDMISFLRVYHGYFVSGGVVFIFWYHPWEATLAHTSGYLQAFLLLWQSVLLYNRSHRNRYWTAFLEGWVVLHAAIVGYYQNYGLVHEILFTGFTAVFLVGPLWGLPWIQTQLSNRKWFYRFLIVFIGIPYMAFVFWVFRKSHWAYRLLCLAVPALYYVFSGLFYLSYTVQKAFLQKLVIEDRIKVGSRSYYSLVILMGFLPFLLLTGMVEGVYQLLVLLLVRNT